ncbi:MAG TPA: DNA repair protein RecO [Candidatus Pelagibacter bacterium]|jgi:DNA repair protein RecO (recombination protein O)|nr:DNA repair protein RecO [Pelagibacteraceae bacterium]HJN84582.1 DNA repair protein RecO [Candidatus Pelagibacter bacterium]|tara:strand:+ start:3091 stop:3771 length:681 start_codon:yes stop_codon:yes gene_type:complete
MHWDDIGYLIAKNKYNENSIIAEFFTEHHGKCSGIIFGATSKKIKNYLQIGNKLHLNYNYKNETKIGYFNIEIFKAYSPLYFEQNRKLSCIISAMNLIKLLTVDYQVNEEILKLIDQLYLIINSDDWVKEYIFWELKLLALVGYNLELSKIAKLEINNNQKKYFVKSNSEKKYIPNFLIDREEKNLDKNTLSNGLKLVGDFLEKNVLKPNNINYPIARTNFINLFK